MISKNPGKIKKAVSLAILVLFPGRGLASGSGRTVYTWEYVLMLVGCFAILFLGIWVMAKIRDSGKEDWEKNKSKVVKARIKVAQWKTIDDLLTPRADGKTYLCWVTYSNMRGEHEVHVKPGTEDMRIILSHIVGCRQVDDTHITETQILAVNHETIEHPAPGMMWKMGLGYLLGGDIGLIAGGLSALGAGYRQDLPNEFTFLVKYDDRESTTETVKEKDDRFKFLIQKLK